MSSSTLCETLDPSMDRRKGNASAIQLSTLVMGVNAMHIQTFAYFFLVYTVHLPILDPALFSSFLCTWVVGSLVSQGLIWVMYHRSGIEKSARGCLQFTRPTSPTILTRPSALVSGHRQDIQGLEAVEQSKRIDLPLLVGLRLSY